MTPIRTARDPKQPHTVALVCEPRERDRLTILTVGHSTRSIEEFIALLQAHGVKQLVDVRTIPRSRHVPQFNQGPLAAKLKAVGIQYAHLKELGGLRHPRKNSINTGWRNASFRGYADYMGGAEFSAALERLLELAQAKRTAIMCAEAVPWRCHRSLIGDALLARGVQVEDIISATACRAHQLTPFARVRGTENYLSCRKQDCGRAERSCARLGWTCVNPFQCFVSETGCDGAFSSRSTFLACGSTGSKRKAASASARAAAVSPRL